MNQDGKVDPSSDYETSDANTSSLNNSLSEEEFSIGSSNIETGGLKLTISCRKRSCDEEVEYSPRANLSNGGTEFAHMSKEEPPKMDDQVLHDDCSSEEAKEETELTTHTLKNDQESDESQTGPAVSQRSQSPAFTAPGVSPPKSAKSGTSKPCTAVERQDTTLQKSISSENLSGVDTFPAALPDMIKVSESTKPICRSKQIGSTNCGISTVHDIHEPLLRIDALPNVSPDSGIISLDESPFGNESPLGEGSVDTQHGTQQSITCNPSLNKKVESVASSITLSEEATKSKHENGDIDSLCRVVRDLPPECPNNNKELVSSNMPQLEQEIEVQFPVKSSAATKEKPVSPKKNCMVDQRKVEGAHKAVADEVPLSPQVPNGSVVILSSPHKISQTMGRKKRGRPPKKKKTLLLKHKKSTLYSGIYGDMSASDDSEIPKTTASNELNTGSINTGSNNSGANQTTNQHSDSGDGTKAVDKVNINCDNSIMKKRNPGRPKGSLSRKHFPVTAARRTYRKTQNKIEVPQTKISAEVTPSKPTQPPGENLKQSPEEKVKRGRGRPRKIPLPESSVDGQAKITASQECTVPKPAQKAPQQTQKRISPKSGRIVKKKYSRKRVFTQRKRKSNTISKPVMKVSKQKKALAEINTTSHQSSSTVNVGQVRGSSRTTAASSNDKAKKMITPIKPKSPGCPEKSVFQDNDLDALLKSVKSSISSQFQSEDAGSDILSFDNPFKVAQPSSFPKMMKPESAGIVKPKPKKPKLHVMMRRTKRKKRKKIQPSKPGLINTQLSSPRKLSVFSNVSAQKKLEKFGVTLQKRPGTFDSSLSEKRLSFFTSRVQPSKILASSRLNVFRSGTGVDGPHRSNTPTDIDQPDYGDKRGKKRHRLLYRKSKHKNIIDPVFAADLDMLVSGLTGMAIAENPADNYIRVRPGEMPLPSIFRVIKIDINKKARDKLFLPEPYGLEKAKPLKPRKETPSPHEIAPTIFKPLCKVGRKKSSSDQAVDQREHSAVSDSSDQCLPPKKRHRLVNLEAAQSSSPVPAPAGETALLKKDLKLPNFKRKGRRPSRKGYGPEDLKSDDRTIPGRLDQQYVGQELTIDTSSYTTGGSSICTPSISPCPSRLSTRSSTLPSLSSPSPTGSTGFRSRHASKSSFALSCPIHSSSAASDRSSCAECHLLEQSVSPATLRSGRATLRSLSIQASESSYSSERPASSSESSPTVKESLATDHLQGRSSRKRRKSSNLSANDSDSSPPRLEKNTSLSPIAYHDSSVFSEPPEITSSPFRTYVSPRRQPSSRTTIVDASVSPSGTRKKLCSNTSPQRNLRQLPSPSKSASVTSPQNLCNKSSSSPKSSSKSVIESASSEYEPLPLEHCRKRKLVEEIKAATECESDDGSFSCEENDDVPVHQSSSNGNSLGQPPRKRFQRVGLFSDFYKDEEPRKRCENMVRCRDKLVYVREEHEFGLLPQPLHIGLHYMRQVQDFQLPYDIWWQHINQQLPKKPEPKIKFRNIRTNVYSDSKVSSRKLEIPLCSCSPPQSGGRSCGDDCLNRMIYTECSPTTCPAGENCDNQKIQKHEWAPSLEKFLTKDRGFGVRTRNFIKSSSFILEYLGEVISEIEFRRRMMEEYSEECHHYALHLDSGSVIDGYRMGNIGRYVNHSCQPNCEMQKWNVNGLYRMVLFASRDIEAGEELSYDYNFDSFNQDTQQECRCGTPDCRGVIGVKTQRSNSTSKLPEKLADDCKDKRKSKLMNKKMKEKPSDSVLVQPPAKPMTFKERCYARKHRTFLVRNVDKVRNQRNPAQDFLPITKEELNVLDCNKFNAQNPDLMLAHLNERSVKTRLAAYAKDSPEMARRHQLAQIFDKMLTELLSLKDEDDNSLVAPLMSLPSRKKQPQYYQVIREPIDLSMIKQRVKTGYYEHLSSFNSDVMLLFSNVELYCGPKSDMGQVILKLRRVFNCVKTDVAAQIDELLGPNTTKSYMDAELERLEQVSCRVSGEPEEDIIRCICGVTRDEGLMLQCEKCMRWQHCDCVQASGKEEHYLCDRCEPRYYDPEILLRPSPPDALPDCTHYMTVVKDDMQYAVGDCVYVMRDCKRSSTGTPLRSSHRLMASVNPDKLDVFRLEQLWKDPKGERFASGTPYLRPQETFHEPTRKFYHNELFRTPNFEIIPMDLVMGKCVVMDPNTYVKGRPKGVKEQDVYICEYRVDKTAHLFHKIQKIWYPINTGRFCFDWFDTKLTIKRTFIPHEVPEEYKRKAERNMAAVPSPKAEPVKQEKFEVKKSSKSHSVGHGKVKVDESIKNDMKLKAEVKVNVKKGGVQKKEMGEPPNIDKSYLLKLKENKRKEKKRRLEKILTKLLNSLPGKQKVDLTYLLEGGKRIRKKVTK